MSVAIDWVHEGPDEARLDDFQTSILQRFRQRRKAIRHKTKAVSLALGFGHSDRDARLIARSEVNSKHANVQLVIWSGGDFRIWAARNTYTSGRIWQFDCEGHLPSDAEAVVAAFEDSMGKLHSNEGGKAEANLAEIWNKWAIVK